MREACKIRILLFIENNEVDENGRYIIKDQKAYEI